MDCLFCKILKKEIPSTQVYEDDFVYAFEDIYPMAKEHVLFISKKHTKNVNKMESQEIANVFKAIKVYTIQNGLEDKGFRIVTNVNEYGGQTVFHSHFHVLGGEKLSSFGAKS